MGQGCFPVLAATTKKSHKNLHSTLFILSMPEFSPNTGQFYMQAPISEQTRSVKLCILGKYSRAVSDTIITLIDDNSTWRKEQEPLTREKIQVTLQLVKNKPNIELRQENKQKSVRVLRLEASEPGEEKREASSQFSSTPHHLPSATQRRWARPRCCLF